MAGETIITLVGNLTADPELRFTPSGAPVANFTVASTPRTFDRQANEWKDGDAMFLNCAVWRQAAENVAESLTKGMRVIVQGRLRSRTYETREGEKRTVFEVDVEEIGPALKYATAKVTRTTGGGGNYGGGSSSGGSNWGNSSGGGSSERSGGTDPWAQAQSDRSDRTDTHLPGSLTAGPGAFRLRPGFRNQGEHHNGLVTAQACEQEEDRAGEVDSHRPH